MMRRRRIFNRNLYLKRRVQLLDLLQDFVTEMNEG